MLTPSVFVTPYTVKFAAGIGLSYENIQTAIARLFGYSNTSTFTSYAQNIVNELILNSAGASINASGRLAYDGSIYTSNGSFILPFSFERAEKETLLACVIVDASGVMSIWVSDLNLLVDMTNLNGEYAAEENDEIVSYGRCMLFEIPSEHNDENVVSTTLIRLYAGWKQSKVEMNYYLLNCR